MIKRIVATAAAAAVLPLVALSAGQAPATAAPRDECSTKEYKKASVWHEDSYYVAPPYEGGKAHGLTLTAQALYKNCPNGSDHALLKVRGWTFCFSQDTPQSGSFKGVSFRAQAFETRNGTLLPFTGEDNVWVPDNGTKGNCKTDLLGSASFTEYSRHNHDPKWKASTQILVNDAPDPARQTWTAGDDQYRNFDPANDPSAAY